MKPIKHPFNFDTECFLTEDDDFPELESVIVNISEIRTDLEDDLDFFQHEYQENNYIKFNFLRVILGQQSDSNTEDLLDSHSGDLVRSVTPIITEENDEFISSALSIDTTENLSKIIYLKSVHIHGDFSEHSIAAATSKAIKLLAKGSYSEEWATVLYKKNTFYKNGQPIKPKELKSIFKELNLFDLPPQASFVRKEDNVLSVASGMTLNIELQQQFNCPVKSIPKVK